MSHILVVEDDEDLLFLYRAALASKGRVVTEAKNAQEAMTILANPEYLPSLIFLDINMAGGQSGFRIIEEIRRTPRLAASEVVVVTANDQHRTPARERGVRHFIVKPFDISEMATLAEQFGA